MSFIANTTSEDGIVITPRAYKIAKATITANNGKEYNLLPTIHNIEIHEGMGRTGLHVRLFIEDAANLADEIKMAYNEKINIRIEREEYSGEKGFDLELFIWGINNYTEPTPSSKSYALECITKHCYLSPKKLLNRAYDDTTAKLIKKILNNDLETEVDVRCSTYKVVKGVYPNISPLYAIAWLLRNSNDNGTPCYLFETPAEGVIFTSYNEILKQDVFHKYNRNPYFTNTLHHKTEKGIFEEERSRIIKVISNNLAGKYESAEKGLYGSIMNKVDIATKTRTTSRYKYEDTDKKLNDEDSTNKFMKIGKNLIQDFKNYKQHYVSENSLAYGKDKNTYHDATGDKELLKRNAYLNALHATELVIKLPGDFEFSSGKIIELEILRQADISEELSDGKDFIDEVLSGKYLVDKVIHHFTKDGYFMTTTIKKDSFVTEQIRNEPGDNTE